MIDLSLALFIAVETCPEPPYYPIAAAWTLPDGSIKSSLILADDSWPPHLCFSDHISGETITALGHSVKDVLLEMNDDLDASHVVATLHQAASNLDDRTGKTFKRIVAATDDLRGAMQVLQDLETETNQLKQQ